jgi:transketolase
MFEGSITTVSYARAIRASALKMVHQAKASHIGTCLSMADLLAVLYGRVMRIDPACPDWPERDRFILSKGHGAAAYFATLAHRGFFPLAWLDDYCKNGSKLAGHVVRHGVPGVELATGSLGHGLSVGCGLALAARQQGAHYRTFVLLSDGECDEGSVWEAALFAGHHHLERLVAVIDHNKIQSFGAVEDVLDLAPFADKWRAFRWAVREINGHDHVAVLKALNELPAEREQPTAIIAHTVKGKGVGFMEDKLLWHYRSPDAEQLAAALAEVGGGP